MLDPQPHAKGPPRPDPKRPSYAEAARTLLAGSRHGVLATSDARGYPYTSVVELLPLEGGDALFLLSDLAEHTKNLKRDPKASLLVATDLESERVLAQARLSLIGVLEPEPDPALLPAYLELHPSAAAYSGFADFHRYRLRPQRAFYIGGFGRMGWVDAEAYRRAEPDPLRRAAPAILAHMNGDHAHNLVAYARALVGVSWAARATMLGLDRYGFDLEVRGGADEEERVKTVRLAFERPVNDPRGVRDEMVRLAAAARAALGA
ncbi:HugZ family protein [Truepera radiovictrix]|uniref:Uncharacterized protein n=1 Tax=Truepera radiovictrix (strain DSM 17093 / CIP 108686 / LMG 22925 / RQ-24) TaxID=649638 RepID=D7CW17_TRURR|nr:DUF2470 domain-containing protein [Truepera radiovictrix]ADI14280.1 Protein of unknown function DUF2470 [Truepera radiovictrix DSM 17093]WMT57163.1 DUF2470 domain-containing protein [Truepera radiovictrix]